MDKVTSFVKEAWGELQKATWLSRKEVMQSTVLVVVFVLIISAYINLVDLGLNQLLRVVFGGR